jgi:hypothetical protein
MVFLKMGFLVLVQADGEARMGWRKVDYPGRRSGLGRCGRGDAEACSREASCSDASRPHQRETAARVGDADTEDGGLVAVRGPTRANRVMSAKSGAERVFVFAEMGGGGNVRMVDGTQLLVTVKRLQGSCSHQAKACSVLSASNFSSLLHLPGT